jgi:hypothetical protein
MKTIYGRRNILSSVSFFSGGTAFLQRLLLKTIFKNKLPANLKFTSQKGVVKGGIGMGEGVKRGKKGNPGSWRSS